jgi:undecaprenyl-diphosphatase
LGLLLHEYITTYLFNPVTVAWALIAGGILILIIERLPLTVRVDSMENVSPLAAFKIGMAQMFSLFPGISRAGATIMGGLLAGLSRTAATEFSFLLAMPVMLAATFYALFKNINSLNAEDVFVFAVGFVMSFLTALIVVKAFLKYVAGHNFTLFALYRIGFGLLVLAYFRG